MPTGNGLTGCPCCQITEISGEAFQLGVFSQVKSCVWLDELLPHMLMRKAGLSNWFCPSVSRSVSVSVMVYLKVAEVV